MIDGVLINELFSILKKAFDNVISDSLDSRIIIVQDAMEEYINAKANNPHSNNISFPSAVDSLNSRLALDVDTLRLIFKDAAKSCGLVV